MYDHKSKYLGQNICLNALFMVSIFLCINVCIYISKSGSTCETWDFCLSVD